MAQVDIIDDQTLRITLGLDDAVTMVQLAGREQAKYAEDIITIYEKCLASRSPIFAFTHTTARRYSNTCSG